MASILKVPFILYEARLDAPHRLFNFGKEAETYIRFIADFYDCLPEVKIPCKYADIGSVKFRASCTWRSSESCLSQTTWESGPSLSQTAWLPYERVCSLDQVWALSFGDRTRNQEKVECKSYFICMPCQDPCVFDTPVGHTVCTFSQRGIMASIQIFGLADAIATMGCCFWFCNAWATAHASDYPLSASGLQSSWRCRRWNSIHRSFLDMQGGGHFTCLCTCSALKPQEGVCTGRSCTCTCSIAPITTTTSISHQATPRRAHESWHPSKTV